jgi:hypothetical protein
MASQHVSPVKAMVRFMGGSVGQLRRASNSDSFSHRSQ